MEPVEHGRGGVEASPLDADELGDGTSANLPHAVAVGGEWTELAHIFSSFKFDGGEIILWLLICGAAVNGGGVGLL